MIEYTNTIAHFFTLEGLVDLIEFFVFVIMAIYTFLAFVMMRQVRLMNRSFSTPAAPVFTLSALIHFCAAALVTVLTFFVI